MLSNAVDLLPEVSISYMAELSSSATQPLYFLYICRFNVCIVQ